MKNVLLSAGFLLLMSIACQRSNDAVEPAPDHRDLRVGSYACEVTIKNFTTEQIFSTYLDTLEISKQGDSLLLVKSYKNAQFPTLVSLDGRGLAYTGIYTNLNFNQGQLELTTGPDIKFYTYKGRKLN